MTRLCPSPGQKLVFHGDDGEDVICLCLCRGRYGAHVIMTLVEGKQPGCFEFT